MALAKIVRKVFPLKSEAEGTLVGIHLTITDDDRPDLGSGTQVVINETIDRQFVSGDGMSNEARDEIGQEAQELIDTYKSLRSKYDKSTYTTKVSQIDSTLTL